VVTRMWRSYVRRVWGANFNGWVGLALPSPPLSLPLQMICTQCVLAFPNALNLFLSLTLLCWEHLMLSATWFCKVAL